MALLPDKSENSGITAPSNTNVPETEDKQPNQQRRDSPSEQEQADHSQVQCAKLNKTPIGPVITI